jgi:hypothetical protein
MINFVKAQKHSAGTDRFVVARRFARRYGCQRAETSVVEKLARFRVKRGEMKNRISGVPKCKNVMACSETVPPEYECFQA